MIPLLKPEDYFRGPTDYTNKERKESESKVENKSCDVARAHGWFTRKYKAPGRIGVQDRIFVKDRRVVFIEYKRIGNEPTGLQCDDASDLREHGGQVYWTNTVRGTKEILGIIT